MRYIDSGSRLPSEALGTWLQDELGDDVSEIRIQSGFYSGEALTPFRPTLAALATSGGLVRVVVGSNDGGTLRSHLDALVDALQLPRPGARLGVVYYGGAFYHPKTYHLRRTDGSQTAYVGSANLTLSGVAAKHVEAGLLCDTRDGDSEELLAQIAVATDAWFDEERPGFEEVGGPLDVQRLLDEGIVRAIPSPRVPRSVGQGGQQPQRPGLGPLIVFPHSAYVADVQTPAAMPDWQPLPLVQQTPPYPPYMYFAPEAAEPTRGIEALSGTELGNATGLIVRLSRDNDRHWRQAAGTANIAIPTSTAATIRFGIYGARARPRAEFDLALRYVDDEVTLVAPVERTGIMSFGFTPGDSGHSDLRLVLPRPPVADLRQRLVERNAPLPQAGDLALLEWPSLASPSFRMTVTDPGSALGLEIRQVWQAAAASAQLASRGACWLPNGVSPPW